MNSVSVNRYFADLRLKCLMLSMQELSPTSYNTVVKTLVFTYPLHQPPSECNLSRNCEHRIKAQILTETKVPIRIRVFNKELNPFLQQTTELLITLDVFLSKDARKKKASYQFGYIQETKPWAHV